MLKNVSIVAGDGGANLCSCGKDAHFVSSAGMGVSF
jgi:hypothetical protein